MDITTLYTIIASVGINTVRDTFEDAMKTLSFTLGVDKIASDTTYSANALYKFEF